MSADQVDTLVCFAWIFALYAGGAALFTGIFLIAVALWAREGKLPPGDLPDLYVVGELDEQSTTER